MAPLEACGEPCIHVYPGKAGMLRALDGRLRGGFSSINPGFRGPKTRDIPGDFSCRAGQRRRDRRRAQRPRATRVAVRGRARVVATARGGVPPDAALPLPAPPAAAARGGACTPRGTTPSPCGRLRWWRGGRAGGPPPLVHAAGGVGTGRWQGLGC